MEVLEEPHSLRRMKGSKLPGLSQSPVAADVPWLLAVPPQTLPRLHLPPLCRSVLCPSLLITRTGHWAQDRP